MAVLHMHCPKCKQEQMFMRSKRTVIERLLKKNSMKVTCHVCESQFWHKPFDEQKLKEI